MRPRMIAASAVVAGAVLAGVPASAAWAPSPIASAWADQTALGYRPCKPIVTPLPLDIKAQGVLADANNGEQYGTCEVRVAWDLSDTDLSWVAWHEVCHLSTVSAIYRQLDVSQYSDPAHAHPFFRQCLRFGPPNPY